MFQRICKITFITHGATIHSLDGVLNDSLKYPKLNELGEEEIERVCEALKKRGVAYDNIYSSPHIYCTQSANMVAKLFHKKATVIDLPNRKHGDFEGMQISEIYEQYGMKGFIQTPPNGESIKKFNKRVQATIKKLIKENQGNRIIVVTTPEVVQAVLASVLELTPENQYKSLIKTGSMTQVSYFADWSSIIYSDYKPL